MARRKGRPKRLTFAFWDTSAVLPLCGLQRQSAKVRQTARMYRLVVWWGTGVEATSGLYRLKREGTLTGPETTHALERLHQLRARWDEVEPTETLRVTAERLLARHKLRAGDALQLAAALEWCEGRPRERIFVVGDDNLLDAAETEGFTCIDVAGH